MNKFNLRDQNLVDTSTCNLTRDIFEAFGHPTIEEHKLLAQARIREIDRGKNFFTKQLIDEEQEILSRFLIRPDPEYFYLNVPTGVLSASLALKFLPYMMTLETNERWGIGRGVRGCAFGSFSPHRYVVEEVMDANRPIQTVVCRYVKLCADCYDDYAIKCWEKIWSKVWNDILSDSKEIL